MLDKLEKDNIKLTTPIIVFQDERVGHILDKKINLSQMLTLWDIINNPDEVYYDYTTEGVIGLAYIRIINDKKCIKVCVKLNRKKRKEPINYISTVGIIERTDLTKNKKSYKK